MCPLAPSFVLVTLVPFAFWAPRVFISFFLPEVLQQMHPNLGPALATPSLWNKQTWELSSQSTIYMV